MNFLDYIESRRELNLSELKDFLRIPSVSTKSEHKPDINRAAQWVADRLHGAGFSKVDIIPTKMHPLVVAESLEAPGKPTILFYGHYDVQPAEPLELWTSPPFDPTVRGGNLYGRGTADDKGQVHIHLKALEALQKSGGKLPLNVKVIIEGEEEVGSVNLWDFVTQNKDRLRADALVVSDTSMLARGVPSITYGLRGLNYYQVEITGPSQDLHSGVFGGAVPNPITILAEMIAKLHDKNFHVTVPGFYDDVATLSAKERKALNSLPWKESEFRRTVGAPGLSGEKGFTNVERLWCRPTLELNGIWGGYTGEGSKTVIPSKAFAKISTRLVPNQNPAKVAKQVERHIRRLLPKTVRCKFEVLSMGKPWVASYTHPIFQKAIHALEKGFGKKAVFIREGGSIPFVTQMHDTFKVPCVLLGFGLPDENAHAPDEHISLENYFGGIKSVASFYSALASL
ncbi:MAG TPA: dipeptidase [Candidatus Acidoferrales bacterium]|jgi:acetylornithine deacetylase/succinyl-diaminopimelate desuccinylase-like protein|nr:dipeptidase [Candidatus Acidoferrales bacterium]